MSKEFQITNMNSYGVDKFPYPSSDPHSTTPNEYAMDREVEHILDEYASQCDIDCHDTVNAADIALSVDIIKRNDETKINTHNLHHNHQGRQSFDSDNRNTRIQTNPFLEESWMKSPTQMEACHNNASKSMFDDLCWKNQSRQYHQQEGDHEGQPFNESSSVMKGAIKSLTEQHQQYHETKTIDEECSKYDSMDYMRCKVDNISISTSPKSNNVLHVKRTQHTGMTRPQSYSPQQYMHQPDDHLNGMQRISNTDIDGAEINLGNNLSSDKKVKKPFLRKGTRKEPSAMHRMQNTNQDNAPDKNKLSESKQEGKMSNSNIEYLEKMQREQIANLEKRLEKREQAREQIQREKDEMRNKTVENKCDSDNMKVNKLKYSQAKNNNHTPTGGKSSHLNSNDDISNSSNEEVSERSFDSFQNIQDDINLKELIKNGKHTGSTRKSGAKLKVKNMGKSEEGVSRSTPSRSPYRKLKVQAGNEKRSQEDIDEQWLVIKSMRKRQENALMAAEKERDEVNAWAQSEREKVRCWIENQRALLSKEKQRLNNSNMVSKRKQRQDTLEEKAAVAVEFSQRRAKEEIESLKEALNKQKIDFDAAKSRQRLNEKRLRDLISEKDEKLRLLSEELDAAVSKNNHLCEALERLGKQRQASEKKKKQKNAEQVSGNNVGQQCGEYRSETRVVDCVDKNMQQKVDDIAPEKKSSPFKPTAIGTQNVTFETKPIHVKDQIKDDNAIRVLENHQDLIQQPSEYWLQRHLGSLQNNRVSQLGSFEPVVQSENWMPHDAVNDESYSTPLHQKRYDPSRYMSSVPGKENLNNVVDNPYNTPCVKHNDKMQQVTPATVNGMERLEQNGRRVIAYANGTKKEILHDGTTIVRFVNGDVKTSYGSLGIVVYYYNETKTSHTTHPDGLQIYEFASGQTEKHFPHGRKEISFPDGTQKTMFPNGESEIIFPDGVRILKHADGSQRVTNF